MASLATAGSTLPSGPVLSMFDPVHVGLDEFGGSVFLTDETVNGNTCTYGGGGIYNEDGHLSVTGGTVNGNTTSFGAGGGIASSLGSMVVSGATIDDNAALQGYEGGGLYLDYQGTSISKSTISGNTAQYGGGVYSEGQTALVDDNIDGNGLASNPDGAAAYGGGVYNYLNLQAEGGQIDGNNATGDGAGVYNSYEASLTGGVQIEDNTAGGNGGGLANEDSSGGTTALVTATVSGNSAANGAGVYNDGPVGRWNGVTVSDNTASNDGGGVYATGGFDFVMTNSSTVSANTAEGTPAPGGGIYADQTNGATTVTLSDNSTASGNTPDNCDPSGSVVGCTG